MGTNAKQMNASIEVAQGIPRFSYIWRPNIGKNTSQGAAHYTVTCHGTGSKCTVGINGKGKNAIIANNQTKQSNPAANNGAHPMQVWFRGPTKNKQSNRDHKGCKYGLR